ncbi:MAG TPA: NAD(P)H-binding protein [Rubricoccaceae bacterium]|jgi:uncharacterized protein YbjT (DUF2867 family)
MPTALLLGSTGLVGRHTLERLARDPRWTRVVTLDRRAVAPVSVTHVPTVVDFDRLDRLAPDVWACDSVFCALGTTIKQAGSQAAFRRVDLEIPADVARRTRAAGATQMLLVSSLGADAGSRIFYNRVKGEAEAAVSAAGFEAVQIVQPSLLTGDRAEARTGERIGEAVLGVLRPLFVGPLQNLRPTAADDVAAALVALAVAHRPGVNRYSPVAIRAWAGAAR